MSFELNSEGVALFLKDLTWNDVRSLCEHLGVQEARLKEIEELHTCTGERVQQSISAWIKSDPDASWAKITSALRAVNQSVLATSLNVGENDVAAIDSSGSTCNKICRLSTAEEFHDRLLQDVKIGMTRQPRWIPSKYRYDKEGSLLFESIIEQPEYYLNRVETEILQSHAKEILQLTNPDEVIELGSGSSKKTRVLIEAMHLTGCRRYVPIDISENALQEATDDLTTDYDWLEVEGKIGDYDHDLSRLRRKGRRLLVIMGTTVGNYTSKKECAEFLLQLKAIMEKGDALLVGIDLLKEVSLIASAYNDEAGANAKFKLRVLDILNREVDSNFEVEDFEHVSNWNAEKSAMESLLRARRDMSISIRSLQMVVAFTKGDEILVGISCKYTYDEFIQELSAVGLKVSASYTDRAEKYGMFVACAV